MSNLESVVTNVVQSFISQDLLFTALDVSNEVKKTVPHARHKEVRDIVRAIYSDMQVAGYSRTVIQVTLADGSQVDALLYHSTIDSWDLDTKYDNQRRTQSHTIHAPVAAPVVLPAPVASVAAQVVPVLSNPKQLWSNLFGGVRIFPRV